MKLKIGIILLITYLSSSVYAEKLNCKTLSACISSVSKITGRQYIVGQKFIGTNFEEVKFEGSKKDIDSLLAQVLFNYGYSRVPSVGNSWLVISSRDIRYNPTPLLESGKDSIPNNYDFMMVAYQLKNKLKANEVTRSFRPFMSRYGRIISMKEEGKIIIQDTGININRLIGLLKMMDREPTEEEVREAKKNKKFRQKLQLIEAKNQKCSPKGSQRKA